MGRDAWSTLAGDIWAAPSRAALAPAAALAWTFLGRNAAAVISALDEVTDLQLLQTPSVLVRNNAEATLNVGSRIPISSVTFNPGSRHRHHLQPGAVPGHRHHPEGAAAGDQATAWCSWTSSRKSARPAPVADPNGNVRIDTRKLKTEAAVQSGDTVMLAGLISDGVTRGSSGFPG